jgi:hypothetical protein
MAMVTKHTNDTAVAYLYELISDIKDKKIEVVTAEKRVTSNSIASLPSGSVTIDFIVLPQDKRY